MDVNGLEKKILQLVRAPPDSFHTLISYINIIGIQLLLTIIIGIQLLVFIH